MSGLLPIVSFVARSGTGKTTFLEQLIPALGRRGLRVMVVKHDVHGFEVDKPGKDTWRLRQAGARKVLIANAEHMALMADCDGDLPLRAWVERHGGDVDLVLSEGYRRSGMPKILVSRKGAREPVDPSEFGEGELLAAVSDQELAVGCPCFPLDDPEPLAAFLVERLLGASASKRELTGVLLAGGRSRRMGEDKAALQFHGAPLLPQLVERLQSQCTGGVLVVKRQWQQLPALPASARVVDDLLPARAAMGGLYTGLVLAETPFVFLAACDMPFLDPSFIGWLRDLSAAGADAVLPVRDGRLESLHAIYGHRCLGAIKEALLSGEYRMGGWHGAVRLERVEEPRWRVVCPDGKSFRNINRPEDLLDAEAAGIDGAAP